MIGCQLVSVCTYALDDCFAFTLYMSASQCCELYYQSFRGASEGSPVLLSGGGRRWDHLTSLHRWQLGLKVNLSRGFLQIIGQVWNSILHAFFSFFFSPLHFARSFITQRDGVSELTTRGREENKNCNLVFYYLSSVIMKNLPQHGFHDIDSSS